MTGIQKKRRQGENAATGWVAIGAELRVARVAPSGDRNAS
jgi:hypothetical protein